MEARLLPGGVGCGGLVRMEMPVGVVVMGMELGVFV